MGTLRQTARALVPVQVRRALWRALWRARLGCRVATHPWRTLPDFLIIGAQRCGTTSLYAYLVEHPCVAPAWAKEVDYFTKNYGKGPAWYRAHFPTWFSQIRRRPLLTGEASPSYLFHPRAPARAAELLPRVKLLVLLRNPVDRAYSHYRAMVKVGAERLSFEEAVESEPERLRGEVERISQDGSYWGFNYDNFSYLSRGHYGEQLKAWMSVFPRERFLVLKSEDLFSQPVRVMGRVFDFLRLPPWIASAYPRHDPYELGRYPEMRPETRRRLLDYFAPDNRALAELLGGSWQWNQ